jgi:hypothetical protein
MDSYPLEFVLQHVPLMAVFGLGTARDLVEQPTSTTSSMPNSPISPKSSQSRRSSLATSTPISTRQQLSRNLLALLTLKNQVGVWGPGKNAGAVFHVVAVEKVC